MGIIVTILLIVFLFLNVWGKIVLALWSFLAGLTVWWTAGAIGIWAWIFQNTSPYDVNQDWPTIWEVEMAFEIS